MFTSLCVKRADKKRGRECCVENPRPGLPHPRPDGRGSPKTPANPGRQAGGGPANKARPRGLLQSRSSPPDTTGLSDEPGDERSLRVRAATEPTSVKPCGPRLRGDYTGGGSWHSDVTICLFAINGQKSGQPHAFCGLDDFSPAFNSGAE